MLNLPTVLLMLVLSHGAAPPDRAQDRAAMAMGFDQEKTAHHFSLYNDGGAIAVIVRDPADTQNLDAIRNHLRHIASLFKAGDFDAPMLVHDTKDVPGIDVLAARKQTLTYRYVETATGGRVDILTTDVDSLHAIHAFLRYQIREHHTGDAGTVTRRQ